MDSGNHSDSAGSNVMADFDSVTCPICLEIYVNPKITNCGHTFCEKCLANFLGLVEPKCPICREIFIPSASVAASDVEKVINASTAVCTGCREEVALSSFRNHLNACEKAQLTSHTAETENDILAKKAIEILPNRHTFRCPYCGLQNFDTNGLLNHVNENHRNSRAQVVCPICASMPWGDPTQKSSNFIVHLNIRHRFEYDTLVDYELDDDAALEKVLKASIEDK